jgi:hypothetical protein
MSEQKRRVGRPPLSDQERSEREKSIDMHVWLPESIVEKIDRLKRFNESRKDYIVRVLQEQDEL